ncbi:G2 mitotic-specific cyclin-2-like [Olea europaea subsp. europaea]|uniref:G2 mitotic-specific cyclin-2-like n=1 Tax=Olea europaea subsp. europaea TaxID=158383 RepID=A0A8S0TNP7_OLEEU|nr:G2 mitotic-specific cyclin-2-like [Olea europaea subsp. europaea]
MVVSEENNSTQIKPTRAQGGAVIGGRKFGMELRPNRRALSAINQNIVGAQPRPYPCVVNKRGLSETNGICDKNPPIQAHRPITRKYAAQRSTLQQPCPEEVKKPKTSVNEFIVLEDTPLADVKDNGAVKDQLVPMSLEQTEIEISEKNQMEEVEMADIFEETITDIDSDDSKDPLAVVDYVEDLYKFYKKTESCSCVSPGYMAQQFDINERMRAILIDWLIEVHHKFELREETLFLTVNLIDRFLAKQTVVRKKLQLVGLVAMLLACKYEEVSVPVLDDLVLISDKAYTRKEVLDMEKLMLNTLQYNLSVPTAYVFIRRFLKAAQFDRKVGTCSLCFVTTYFLGVNS